MRKSLFFFVVVSVFSFIQAQTLLRSGLTCAEKKLATDFHNELRLQVANGMLAGQPKAANMQKLVWDDNLAILAQKWADNMNYMHNPGKTDPRFSVGENIYKSYGASNIDSIFDVKRAINKWYGENLKYTYTPIGNQSGTGHYTQVVWANTQYVGCGASYFKGIDGMFTKYYVCDYGMAGNFKGEYPYAQGVGCENLCCKDQCGKLYGNSCQ